MGMEEEQLSKEYIMKKIPSTFLVTFISILITLSCDDDPVSVKDKIVGGWFWVQTISGWTGDIITPDSTGYSKILVFEEDGTYKEYQVHTDIDTVMVGSYEIVQREYNNRELDILIINHRVYQSYLELVILFIDNNKLVLKGNCIDCDKDTYLKQIDEFPLY